MAKKQLDISDNLLKYTAVGAIVVASARGYFSDGAIPSLANALTAAVMAPAFVLLPAFLVSFAVAAILSNFTERRTIGVLFVAATAFFALWLDFTIHADSGCDGMWVERNRWGGMECWVP